MSDQYLQLVAALAPRGAQRYFDAVPVEPRSRFVLVMLAYLADEHGRCTISLADLAGLTWGSIPTVRLALRDLENEHGFISTSYQLSGPNTYQLHRSALEAKQPSQLMRAERRSVRLLADYGLDNRCINTLQRIGIETMDDLVAVVADYRSRLTGGPLRFHDYLRSRGDAPGLGEITGRKILDTYLAWCQDNREDGR